MTPPAKKDVLGIDFGTSNTYITICPYGTKNKMPLHLFGRTPAIDTAILYSDANHADRDVFPIVGESATLTYGQADPSQMESEGYRYYANFKLDIVKSQIAKSLFVDFFKCVERDAALNGTPLRWSENQVIIGVPSEAPQEFRDTIKELAKKAGLGEVETLDEPKGALITDLGYSRFPLSDILDGYLVVDFGGGTCDFAFLRKGEVESSWGEMALGGRLFDDVFFQWFLDQNPQSLKELKSEHRDFYALTYLSRRLKEDFSETVTKNPKAVFNMELGRFGAIRGLSREEFLERAKAYSPSSTFSDFQGKFGIDLGEKLEQGKVDLLAWFEKALFQGLDSGKVRAVSLAGGSSRWFFVRDILIKNLSLSQKKILNSPNPFGAISEGLAILPAVKQDFDTIKKNIQRDRESFFQNRILRFVKDSLNQAQEKLVNRILDDFFQHSLVPALKAHKDESTNIHALEREIESLSQAYNPKLRALVEESVAGQFGAIYTIAQRKIEEWLSSYKVAAAGKLVYDAASLGPVKVELSMGDELAEPLYLAIGGIVSTLVGVLSASICGGAGIALLAAGPAGLLLGAAGGAALSGAIFILGKDRVKSYLKDKELPSFITGLVVSDTVLSQVRGHLKDSLNKEIGVLFETCLRAFTQEIDRMITAVIDRIGIVNIFLDRELR
ncbi:MAG: rod shape-determining protein [Deltaproteobacteria bacterium]|jgi:hypothetical protein|nr:rod shape-determining protein [Deltaproteobacteria bacterium]